MLKKLFGLCFLVVSLRTQPLDQKVFGEVFKKTRDSVVTIRISTTVIINGQPRTTEGGGSGSIVSLEGLIVTNKHVVNDTTRSFKVVLSDGREFSASFVGMAPDTDLSLIKLNTTPAGLKPITLGDSDKIEEGDWVLVIGSPFGLGGTLTAGIISAKERPISIPSDSELTQPPHTLIQTDTAINPGNSGGALINLNSELIGVPTMNLSKTGASVGIGFAIPVNVVKRVLQDITNKKTTVGWLGLLVQDLSNLSPTARKQLGISTESGIIVTGLEIAGPAQKAGIKQYDTILEIEGQKINSTTGFQWLERNLSPGETITLKIQRRGMTTTEEIRTVVGEPIQEKTGQK